MPAPFIHLNVHSEYSLSDSLLRVDALIARVVELKMPAVALTDRMNVFALAKFYRAAEARGIKPIIGADVQLLNPQDPASPHRITLLCRDHAGYLNLSRLLTRAYLEANGQYGAQISREWFATLGDGLFALLGRQSALAAIDDEGMRAQEIGFWRAQFGERLLLSVARRGMPADQAFEALALSVSADFDIPAVANNEARFLDFDDFDAHEARVCIASSRVLADQSRPRLYSPEQYLKSPAAMHDAFADLPQLLDSTVELARACNVVMGFGKYYLPAYPTPKAEAEDSYLVAQSRVGLSERLSRFGGDPRFTEEAYIERLDLELGVINKMGFAGYFLIVADFIAWAKTHDIPVGPGRGSGAGSLVAWALKITDLDPLRYDLLFERFLNPERVSMPDFDIDFCMDRREEVIDYVGERYGRDRVAQIVTYGSMAAKAVIRDTGRVLGHPYGLVDSVAKLIPLTPLDMTLELALSKEPELKARYEAEDEVRELIDLARKLEGLVRNAGKHAGGVVIAPSPLPDFVPLYTDQSAEGGVTQFDKDDVEAIGLVKFDFLGLRTLTIIDWALKDIALKRIARNQPALDLATLPMDDAKTYELLKSCKTTAVFQLESRGMKDLVRRLQPDCFDDIVALVALFRPGPLESGMVQTYVDLKHGRGRVEYPHPWLEPILKPTHGVIVYQEQVMQIAQVLGGYTLGGADLLRRAMGKKKPEEMAQQRSIFVDGATALGVDEKLSSPIFDLMEKFAGYGFNKSHSAAYALLSYHTAYLKAHYPTEFMAAVLSSDMDSTDKVVNFIDDARDRGLIILKPDVNRPTYPFKPLANGEILYGLGAIKGVGEGAVRNIVEERERAGPYQSLHDLTQRIDLKHANRRVLEALIIAGALDQFNVHRAQLLEDVDDALKSADQSLRDRLSGQVDMFGGTVSAQESVKAVVAPWDALTLLRGEREKLGFYFSGHPFDTYRAHTKHMATTVIGELTDRYGEISNDPAERKRAPSIALAGIVTQLRRSESMAFAQIEDHTGRIEVGLFREACAEFAHKLVKDQVIIVEGQLSSDDFNGGYQLRAKRVMDLDEACALHARGLIVTLQSASARTISDVQATLRAHPGQAPIRVRLNTQGLRADFDLDDSHRVRPSLNLLECLRRLSGVLQAEMVY